LTRAKAAALETTDISKDAVKKPLQRSKSAAVGGRKRAALGDVSNVVKNEAVGEEKEGKKLMGGKSSTASGLGLAGKTTAGSLASKAAQTSRVQKLSRSQSTRSILGAKDKNSTNTDLKRPASGSGVTGPVAKKRHTGSSNSSKSLPEQDEELAEDENVAPVKQKVTVELQKTVTTKLHIMKQEEPVVHERPATPQFELPADVHDLDAEDVDDPLMVSEYVNEIFDYLRELELHTMANKDYMDNQSELEWKMRGILVDWLLEVHTRFRLLPETLFLAVNIIDRFLSSKVVQLDRLQLVGVTAMFIASKYEEVLSPHVQNFRHVADDGFTEEEILSAERFVLTALDYDLSYPNPMNFLRRISKADNYDVQTRTLGKYLLEISCLDHRFLEYPPSHVSAAAMYLARMVLDRGEWVSATTSSCSIIFSLTSIGCHSCTLCRLYRGGGSTCVLAHG
jgi:hypothetical protein